MVTVISKTTTSLKYATVVPIPLLTRLAGEVRRSSNFPCQVSRRGLAADLFNTLLKQRHKPVSDGDEPEREQRTDERSCLQP